MGTGTKHRRHGCSWRHQGRAGHGHPQRRLDVGAGFNANTAQSLVDTATNKSGSASQQDQKHAAQIVTGAVNDVMRNTKDAGVRSAAQSFSADFQQATRASEQRSASVSHDAAAGNSRQEGTTNQVGGSFSLGTPTGRELLAMAGGDPAQALRLAQDPNALAAATAAAAAHAAGRGARAARCRRRPGAGRRRRSRRKATPRWAHWLARPAASWRRPCRPASRRGGAAAGQPHVGPGYLAGDDWLHRDRQRGIGRLPGAPRLTFPCARGATEAAAALYNAEQKGAGTVLANTFLAGWGYQSPAEYQGALMEAAAARPRLANSCATSGKAAGKVSPAAMEFIQSEVKAYKDSKE